jgi:acyl-CoA thioesterase-2
MHPRAADAPPPEAVLSQAERFARYGADERVPERMRRALAQRAALPFPLDFRIVDPVDKVAPQARPARQLAWMRAPEPLGDDPALHRCVVAYGSDFALLETALLPHAAAVPSSKLTAASIGASAATCGSCGIAARLNDARRSRHVVSHAVQGG